MEINILDGKLLANKMLKNLKIVVNDMTTKPTLAVIVAEEDAASLAYVQMKQKWAEKIGAKSKLYFVNSKTSEDDILHHLSYLNDDPDVHGILVQHPLPHHINESLILSSVNVSKDVDGISPQSIGLLASRMSGHRPATPLGVIKLLDEYNVNLRGAHVVIAGCSIILGRPMALMFIERDATVCITHKYTNDFSKLTRAADIIVSATGVPNLINGDDVKDGVIVVDCGYTIQNGKISGDVNYDDVQKKAKLITPVPGGVGPMTVATLLSNLVDACLQQTS
jgi:methylenetetrahydrofolate dehydrogenase (NADP+)/methenyltetrahydrofolate cyclohydrolase